MVEATGAPIVESSRRWTTTKLHHCQGRRRNWVDIELFGRQVLPGPNGIPSFGEGDPEQFQHCFIEWVQAVAQLTQGEVVAIDGTVRRSHDRTLGKGAIHMVNVWASSNGLALGQTKVEEKSNEITAIPKLLHMLDLTGCIVTIGGLPEGDRPGDRRGSGRLSAGGEEESRPGTKTFTTFSREPRNSTSRASPTTSPAR